jgi:hypothetical protein
LLSVDALVEEVRRGGSVRWRSDGRSGSMLVMMAESFSSVEQGKRKGLHVGWLD